jgi:AraC-like DNA-binding protein
MEEEIVVPPGEATRAQNLPLVRTAILKPVLLALQNEGHEVSDILENEGITEAQLHDAKAFITHDAVYAVYQEVAARTQPDFCARVGQTLNWEQFFPLFDQLVGAVTLSDFFTRFATAVSKETNSVTQSLLVEGEHAYFSAKRKFKPKISPAQVDAFQVAIWVSLLHRVLDFRWDPSMLVVRVHDPDALPKDFHGVRAIGCDARGFSIRFPSNWLTYKMTPDLLNSDDGLYLDRDLSAPTDFFASVQNILRPHLGAADLDVAAAAKLCGFGVDTLNRRLARYDITVSGVLSRLRQEEAERALVNDVQPIGAIARQLGYSDATAFTRAFRKWTGLSPSTFRKLAQDRGT